LAVEAAIKAAWFHQIRKMGQDVYPKSIISIKNGFHGINSFGNFLSDTDRVQKYIQVTETSAIDVLPVCEIWPLSEFSSDYLSANLFNGAAAIIVEPVQCTAGDIYLDIDFLKKLRQVCTQSGIPLIFDEIQTGFGTTGKVWYWQHIGVEPDIIVFGKKAQVSGIMVKDEFAGIFSHNDKLSVTFDGDLIDMIRCKYIIREIKNNQLLQNITFVGEMLKLWISLLPQIQNVRGIGGLIAFDLPSGQERDEFVKRAFENGLLCNPTAERSVRLRPNLATTIKEVEQCTAIINSTIDKLYL
jgi:L-lysine 6-transaminase